MSKTLYITDLDGTLLRPDQTVSPYTVDTLNRFIDRGGLFSVATARNLTGLKMLDLSGIRWRCPLVVGSGVMLYDLGRQKIIDCRNMPEETVRHILRLCGEYGKTPMLFQARGDQVLVTTKGASSPGEKVFIETRNARIPGCIRFAPDYAPEGGAFYFSMQDTREKLEALAARLKEIQGISYTLYRDNYMDDNWYVEIFSHEAGKDKGLLRLKERLGADRVVAFGDNLNDLPMLEAADVGCVVANGIQGAKEKADVIIGSNEEDGVARYIEQMEL